MAPLAGTAAWAVKIAWMEGDAKKERVGASAQKDGLASYAMKAVS